MEVCDVDDGKSGCAGCSGLEKTIEEAEGWWEDGDGWVVELGTLVMITCRM